MSQEPRPATRSALTRRVFLGGAGAILAAPAVVLGAGARPRVADGVASGDATAGGAVIWSRCDRPARMIVEYATTDSFRAARRVRGTDALPDTGFTAQATLGGLPPGQTVFYRVVFEDISGAGAASEPVVGRLRTAPVSAGGSVRFAFGGDQCGAGWGINPDWGGLRLYETMLQADPDVLIHLGDRIYADNVLQPEVALDDGTVWRNIVTAAKAKVAETLDEFRGAYRYNFLDAHYRAFSAAVPMLATWDDHEVTNNWWPGRALPRKKGYETGSADVLHRRARRAFFDYTPMRRSANPAQPIYRAVRYGPLLEVFLLDTRSFRGPNDRNRQDGADAAAAMLGARQTAWLKDALARSTALWKVIGNSVAIAVPGNPDLKRYDKWANGEDGPPLGREIELAGILSFIKARGIRNTVWLTADVHYAAVHRFHPDRAAITDFKPFWEFVSGPFHTRARRPHGLDQTFGPERLFASTPKTLRRNHPPSDGYLYFGLGRIDGASGALTISQHDLTGKTLYEVVLEPER